jgi:hypothetical protein
MFNDNKSSYNASRAFTVMHLNADIRSSLIIGAPNPPDNGSNLTESMATRGFFVRKRTPFAVFELSTTLVQVKMKAGHLSQFLRRWFAYRISVGSSCDCEPRIWDFASSW